MMRTGNTGVAAYLGALASILAVATPEPQGYISRKREIEADDIDLQYPYERIRGNGKPYRGAGKREKAMAGRRANLKRMQLEKQRRRA